MQLNCWVQIGFSWLVATIRNSLIIALFFSTVHPDPDAPNSNSVEGPSFIVSRLKPHCEPDRQVLRCSVEAPTPGWLPLCECASHVADTRFRGLHHGMTD